MQMPAYQTSPFLMPWAPVGYSAPLLTQPVAWNLGMMAGAYAQAQQVAAGMVRDAQDGATTLERRAIAVPQAPKPSASAAADPDSKAHAGKRKRDETAREVSPACVKPGVWKAAKAAAAARDKADAFHCDLLDNALESGSKGPKAVKAFLQAYVDTPENRLQPEADFMLGDRVYEFLCALEGAPTHVPYSQRLAWALDLVRQLPAQHRPGQTWDVASIALALQPLACALHES